MNACVFCSMQSLLPPLVGASQEGNTEIVKFLLKTEAHQDAVNPVCIHTYIGDYVRTVYMW